MIYFLFLYVASAKNITQKEVANKTIAKPKEDIKKTKLAKEIENDEKLGNETDSSSLIDIIDSIDTDEIIDCLDEKVNEIVDGLKDELKVAKKKALKEVKRGAKRLTKKLKKSLKKKHL